MEFYQSLGVVVYVFLGIVWMLVTALKPNLHNLDKILGVVFFLHTIVLLIISLLFYGVQAAVNSVPSWLFKEWK